MNTRSFWGTLVFCVLLPMLVLALLLCALVEPEEFTESEADFW